MTQPAKTVFYYAMALDPIHVGTGGYRLGRVDNSIVREPGTNLPKLPGTSLSGACRAYAAMVTGRYNWQENGRSYSCAGQGQEDTQRNKAGHCGRSSCPVCVAFGFARDRSGFQGLAQFADVRLLFFPVHSLAGPVWVTCPAVLADAGLSVDTEPADDKIRLAVGLKVANNRLNLGWLMLPAEDQFQLVNTSLPVPGEILQRSVLVPNKLFAQIINDNLEVRTSVSINPETGAAEEGALFTYEAIPRSAVFWFPITYLDPQFFTISGQMPVPQINGQATTVQDVVQKGLAQFEHLGIGGMNTRGMGRLRIFLPEQGG
ncbi:MAG: type III-B CRISPR module RAMP protein Cmr4 [Anaerolineae bacterium]|nr:type III-B CRISPR module RAMP protein Cmr4 [Anaerolineae bacterium]